MSKRASIIPEYVKEILDAFNRRDVDAIVDFFTDDAEWLLARGPEPCGRRLVGKEQIRELLATRFEMIPDMRWVDSKSWIHGNQAVSEWRVQGRRRRVKKSTGSAATSGSSATARSPRKIRTGNMSRKSSEVGLLFEVRAERTAGHRDV